MHLQMAWAQMGEKHFGLGALSCGYKSEAEEERETLMYMLITTHGLLCGYCRNSGTVDV